MDVGVDPAVADTDAVQVDVERTVAVLVAHERAVGKRGNWMVRRWCVVVSTSEKRSLQKRLYERSVDSTVVAGILETHMERG